MKRGSGWFAASALALALLLPGAARADVVDAPPDDCPDGAIGATCHGGTFCTAAFCSTSADCKSGQSCLPTALCTQKFDCGFGDGSIEVLGSCANGCAGTCQPLTVCTVTGGTTSSTSATTASAGGGGSGGAGGAGGAGGGGGNDLIVTGCACTMDGRRTASGIAGTVLLAIGLAGLAGRRSKRPRGK